MRKIKYIVVHCTDTVASATVEAITRFWKNVRKWKLPGYHYLVKASGETVQLLDEATPSNGVLGFNSECINISYIGGRTPDGKSADTRTPAQEESIFRMILNLQKRYPGTELKGHGEFPKQGGRTCPNFNVRDWFKKYSEKVNPK